MKWLRDWTMIAQLPCRATQIALATCVDKDTLRALRRAFPGCFRKGEDHEYDQFPWSAIQAAAIESIKEDGTYEDCPQRIPRIAPYCWLIHRNAAFQNLPIAGEWEDAPPQKVLAQIEGKALAGPLFVEYNSIRCTVALIDYYGDGGWLEEGMTVPVWKERMGIVLVPASAIAFDF